MQIRLVRLEQTLSCYQTLSQKSARAGAVLAQPVKTLRPVPSTAKQKENLHVSGVGVKHALYT